MLLKRLQAITVEIISVVIIHCRSKWLMYEPFGCSVTYDILAVCEVCLNIEYIILVMKAWSIEVAHI